MRYLVPLLAVIGLATLSPNNSFSLAGYVTLSLYSVFLMTGLLQKGSPAMRHPILIGSFGALFVGLGLGAFLYFR